MFSIETGLTGAFCEIISFPSLFTNIVSSILMPIFQNILGILSDGLMYIPGSIVNNIPGSNIINILLSPFDLYR
nr:hypothetical protein [Candidatus Kinetoplastibacterium galatii]